MTNTLSLAARLRAMDDAALAVVIVGRHIQGHGIKDFFDLAEAILDRDSIQATLSRLDRTTLACLAALSVAPASRATATGVTAQLSAWGAPSLSAQTVTRRLDTAAELLLVEIADAGPAANTAPGAAAKPASAALERCYALYEQVRDQLHSWPAIGLPSEIELATAPSPSALVPVPATEARFTDRLAAEHAFSSVNRVSELVAELGREPAKELQKGGLALPASKRIAAALSVGLADVPSILSIAARAGLVAQDSATWFPTDAGASWQLEATTARWAALAEAWLAALPEDIRSLLGERAHAAWGDGLRDYVEWVYPAGGNWMHERIAGYVRDAEVLGLTARQAPSTPGVLLLEGEPAAAAAAISELFPPEVGQVYLQHDLTIVSPGPLTPAIDSRLRTLADVESRALASTYRVSAASLNRAIGTGETAETLREFLGGISLTGIPQPLDYLITEAAERYGRVRVADVPPADLDHRATGEQDYIEASARSSVRSDDRHLLRTIEVDQTLTPLALIRTDPNRLVSRFSREVVFWALSDARYPVAAEDSNGRPVSLRRNRVLHTPRVDRVDPSAALIKRLREEGELDATETSDAWMARQLDIAIRGRVPLKVSVAMPDGRVVDYVLEPTGIGGGRLRGRDRGADIERTLPLSSIRSVGPAE